MSLPHNDMNKLAGIVFCLFLILVGFAGLRSCENPWFGPGRPSIDTVRVVDTVWQKKDSVIVKKVRIKEIIHDTVALKEYQAHDNYDSLRAQYSALAKLFTNKNLYEDSLIIPEIKGLIIIQDTIQKNLIFGRKFLVNYSLPTIKETLTITKTEPSKRQLYLGGGISANQTNISSVQLGALYKTRKDWAFGVYTNINPQGSISYGVQSYWKVSLFNRK